MGSIPNLAAEPLNIKKLRDLFEQDEFLRIECNEISKCGHQALWRSRLGEQEMNRYISKDGVLSTGRIEEVFCVPRF